MGSTVSVMEDEHNGIVEGVPCLVRVMSCDRPLLASTRIPLDDAERVLAGRGDSDEVAGTANVAVRVADGRMSTEHFQLVRRGSRFVLADSGSKNGTTVNGRRVEAAVELADGDVVESGHTFFIYRARVPRRLPANPTTIGEPGASNELPLTTFLPSLARQFERLAKIAGSKIPITVLGETGTGKEVVANAVHRMSGRTGPFIALNCGAIPATLVESELFGVRKGAFSGAVEDRAGLIRSADGGTLFLDEIGELPSPAQVALLRVLQEHEVMPIGGTRPFKVDVRMVAATHRSLERMVDESSFRADLFARMGGLTVRLPALRERREDLGLIIAGLLRRITPAAERVRLSRAAARVLFVHPFPHNIRELEKALALAVAIAETETGPIDVELEDLPEELRVGTRVLAAPPPEAAEPTDEERKAHLIALLEQHRGNVANVARAMGKARMQIHRWLQRYDIDLEAYRKR